MSQPLPPPVPSFDDFGLPEKLRSAVCALGITTPTEIQARAIPAALRGRDIIACAQTGSGKTIAFLLPLLTKLAANRQERALVLTPTRELAEQIATVVHTLAQGPDHFRVSCLIGGAPIFSQTRNLRKNPQLVVATPGRLCDHLKRGNLELGHFRYLVLDEADRMLDMGFAPQLEVVIHQMPRERQTLLFSATFPQNVEKLMQKILRSPERIFAAKFKEPLKTIKHEWVRLEAQEKFPRLLTELGKRAGSVLVFARTKVRTDRLFWVLKKEGLPATLIHGNRSQRERREAIEGFREGKYRILVATDVAARGLDIPDIAHVVNFDLPDCAEDFIHRIGRTGRAGASGEALNFVSQDEEDSFRAISKLLAGDTNTTNVWNQRRPVPRGARTQHRGQRKAPGAQQPPTPGGKYGRRSRWSGRPKRPEGSI